jgi:Sec-independent protein translocase TatC
MGRRKKLGDAVKEMSFLDHLEELRWHLIRSTTAVVILAVLAFIAKDFIFDVLLFGPKKSRLPYIQTSLSCFTGHWDG